MGEEQEEQEPRKMYIEQRNTESIPLCGVIDTIHVHGRVNERSVCMPYVLYQLPRLSRYCHSERGLLLLHRWLLTMVLLFAAPVSVTAEEDTHAHTRISKKKKKKTKKKKKKTQKKTQSDAVPI